MEEKIKRKKTSSEKLATEMIREIKANARRWFIAFLIVLVLWFFTIILFINYLSQPVEETITYTQDADSSDNSTINQRIGD